MDCFVGLNLAYGNQISTVTRLDFEHWVWIELKKLMQSSIAYHVLVNIYIRLQVVDKCKDEAFRRIAGHLIMIVGFDTCVLGLWIVLQEWKFFPLLVYVFGTALTIAG